MIRINGRVFSRNSVTIVDGQQTGYNRCNEIDKTQKFDQIKAEDCSNIDKITIKSTFCDVNVSVSNSSKVEAHFYGKAIIDREVNFVFRAVNSELIITLETTGTCFNGNLKLDVTVPKKTFKVISAKSSSADITLNEGVSTDYLKVKTQSGDLETNATVNNVSVSTMSGDVELCIDATQDINVGVSTMSGDVSAEFNNIGHINLSTSSMSGDVRNRHKESRGYNADVDISTMSGDIRIR